MNLGGGQLVVAEVELRQVVQQGQVVAADFRDVVVEQHEGLGPSWQASGNALQQIVVHVKSVELLQTLEKTRIKEIRNCEQEQRRNAEHAMRNEQTWKAVG